MGPAFRTLLAAGARIAFGTDAGAIPNVGHHQMVGGLLTFGSCAGLRPAELLRTATSEAAAACCLEGTAGAVAEGLAADLLVVPGDPLTGMAQLEHALRHPRAIVARGRPINPCRPDDADAAAAQPAWSVAPGGAACACTRRMRQLSAQGAPPSTLSREETDAIRNTCLADDIDIDYDKMSSWSADRVRAFFENGGRDVPAPKA
jgi:hypothetical protein